MDYYGAPDSPSTRSQPSRWRRPASLTIQPWDPQRLLRAIEKAIQTSDIGINPQNDGSVIRLVFPPLTEERRKELSKGISKQGEDAKVVIRNIRRDADG